MKKYHLLLLLFFVFIQNTKAQWTTVNVGTTDDINGISFYGTDNIYLSGGIVDFISSTNGGNSWTILPLLGTGGGQLLGSELYDMHFINANTGVATGFITTGNSEVVLRTTNAGVNWTIVNVNNNGTWPRNLNDIFFVDASTGYAVGTNGRILKSTDAGLTWVSQSSGTSGTLEEVFFTSATSGFAVGDNVILKTTNGGSSWTVQTFSTQYFNAVYFINSSTGYALGNDLYKTTDGGANWQVLSTMGGDDICFVSATTGYIAGGGILKTTDGGVNWETMPSADGYGFNAIEFTDATTGWAVGDNGIVMKTTNGGGTSAPIATMTNGNTSNLCPGDTVNFTNHSNPAYTFQWLVNGSVASTSYSTTLTCDTPGTYTVQLVAYNGFHYDTTNTVSIYIVSPPAALPFTTNVSDNHICANQSVTISVPSAYGMYQLRKDTINIGNPQYGSGGTLNFSTGWLSATTVFNIKKRIIGSCDTVYAYSYDTIYVHSPLTTLSVIAADTLLCTGDSTVITVSFTEPGISYRLYKGTQAVGGSQTGNGSDLVFTTGAITTNSLYEVKATNYIPGNYNCVSVMTMHPLINIDSVKADFDISAANIFQEEVLVLYDSSYGGNYNWDFGSGAVPATSALYSPPPINYSAIGEKTIQLVVATTALGCADTMTTTLSVWNHADGSTGSLCFYDTVAGSTGIYLYYDDVVLDYHVDDIGNSYVCGYTKGGISWWDVCNMFITKISPAGQVLWEKRYDPFQQVSYPSDYYSTFCNALTTDHSGNIYVTGSFSNTSFTLDGITVGDPDGGSQGFTAKLDSNGTAQWIIHQYRLQTGKSNGLTGGTDIKYVDDDNIFVSLVLGAGNRLQLPDTSIYLNSNYGNFKIVKINSSATAGKIVGEMDDYYNNDYGLLSRHNPFSHTLYSDRITPISPKMKITPDGKIIVSGNYKNGLSIGNLTPLEVINNGTSGFVAVLDTALGWQRSFTTFSEYNTSGSQLWAMSAPSFDIDRNSNIYIPASWYQSSSNSFDHYVMDINGQILPGERGSVLLKYDTTGTLQWYNQNSYFITRSIACSSPDNIYFYGDFGPFYGTVDDIIGFNSQNQTGVGVRSTGIKDIFLGSFNENGNLNWLNNIGTNGNDFAAFLRVKPCNDNLYFTGTLDTTASFYGNNLFNTGRQLFVSKFSATNNCSDITDCILQADFSAGNIDGCLMPTVNFINYSPYATGLYWDFGDGTTSTLQNPQHTYTDTGQYSVTLIATNGTYTDTITRTFDVTITPISVPDVTTDTNSVCQPGNYCSYQWYRNDTLITGATNSCYDITASGFYKVEVTTCEGCSGTSAPIDMSYEVFAGFSSEDMSDCLTPLIQFTDLSQYANQWQWDFGDGATSTLQNPTHTYSGWGQYTVTLIASNAYTSDTLTQLINVWQDYVQVPHYTRSGNTLCIPDTFCTYQWYREPDILLAGATNNCYTMTQEGMYCVWVTTCAGCPGHSSCSYLYLNPSGIENAGSSEEDKVSVYPNPSSGTINLEFPVMGTSLVEIEIRNMTGQLVYSSSEVMNKGTCTKTFKPNLAAGVYSLNIQTKEYETVRKINIIK